MTNGFRIDNSPRFVDTIFCGSNSTGYWTDNAVIIGNNTSSTSGCLIINSGLSGNIMYRFVVSGYDYTSTTGSWELDVGGYFYGDGNRMVNSTYQVKGKPPFSLTFRAARDGSNNWCLLIGADTDTYAYPKIKVAAMMGFGVSSPISITNVAASIGSTASGYTVVSGTSTRVDTLPVSQLSGTLAISQGGTGQTSAGAAFDALSTMSTLGDLVYRSSSAATRLAGNTTTTKKYLSQTGTGSVSAAPAWSQINTSDLSGTISNAQLANSSFTLGSTSVSLGSTATIIDFLAQIGLGGSHGNNVTLYIRGTAPSTSTSTFGVYHSQTIPSTSTVKSTAYCISNALQSGIWSLVNNFGIELHGLPHKDQVTVANDFGQFIGMQMAATTNYGLFVTGTNANTGSASNSTITNVSVTSNVATITTSASHGYVVGDIVTVAATTNTSVNGSGYSITAVTSNTFSYSVTTANITSTSDTGTVYPAVGYGVYVPGLVSNYFAGSIGIGGSIARPTVGLYVNNNLTGGSTTYGEYIRNQIQADVTSAYGSCVSSNLAANTTLSVYNNYCATKGTWSSGSSVTTQNGFYVTSSLTGATNNYGFRGSLASAVGVYNLYFDGTAASYFGGNVLIGNSTDNGVDDLQVTGTSYFSDKLKLNSSSTATARLNMPQGTAPTSPNNGDVWTTSTGLYVRINGVTVGPLIDPTGGLYLSDNTTNTSNPLVFATGTGSVQDLYTSSSLINVNPHFGNLGLGGSASTSIGLRVTGNGGTGTTTQGISVDQTIQTNTTSTWYSYHSNVGVASGIGITNIRHFVADGANISSSTGITNVYGFQVSGNLADTGSTVYGFYSSLALGSNTNWNLYISGTASNYIASKLLLGSTTDTSSGILQVTGNASVTGSISVASVTTTASATATSGGVNDSRGDVRCLSFNSQSGDYTLVAADANMGILKTGSTAYTATIPANSSVAYSVGTRLYFVNANASGNMTIAITTDTMTLATSGTTGSRTLAPWGIAVAYKYASTSWIIRGDGLT